MTGNFRKDHQGYQLDHSCDVIKAQLVQMCHDVECQQLDIVARVLILNMGLKSYVLFRLNWFISTKEQSSHTHTVCTIEKGIDVMDRMCSK